MKNMIKGYGSSVTVKIENDIEMIMQSAAKQDRKYFELIKRFPLKPIRSEKENELAAQICDELLDRFDSLSSLERDYLEILSDLIEHYESKWNEEADVEPRALLKFLMEQNKLSQSDLIPELGSSSRASEFLSGKRELSLTQIIKLASRFKLSPAAFILRTQSKLLG
jgi:HTH-type transcriptional regulator / antitoxin HigA